jgi:Endonuclease/Exonuclease/phosphatase family
MRLTLISVSLLAGQICLAIAQPQPEPHRLPQIQPLPQDPGLTAVTVRVATFNLEDVRTAELREPSSTRIKALAELIQRLRPNIILLNEITFDQPGDPGFSSGEEPGQNAQRFIDHFLATPQSEGLSPIKYVAFMAPTNTGLPSGFDLNNDGLIVKQPPVVLEDDRGRRTPEADAFAQDCWGYGTFPGQYGMALLVDERLTIDTKGVRTFRLLPWDYLPGAMLPADQPAGDQPNAPTPALTNGSGTPPAPAPETDLKPWFDGEELKLARLSSKSFWDVPVKMPNGRVLHLLCSHPTPPAFDGPEERNKRRNHDEIRLIADYIQAEPYLVDDANIAGGLPDGASFVILGDLNADPDEGSSKDEPITKLLFEQPRVNSEIVPISDVPIEGLDADDTARFKLRVDYVLPSTDLAILAAGVWRSNPVTRFDERRSFPSDHFPVWMDLRVDP